MKKILLGIFILLVLIIVTAAIAPFVINLDKYKVTILSRIKPYVPREVDFDHVELTVLTGFGAELQGFRISGNPSFYEEDFLQLESLKIRIRLLPLLKKEYEINKIILNHPLVRLARNADGQFCFSDFLPGDSAQEKADKKNGPEEASQGAGILGGLLVNNLQIEKAKIIYQDDKLWPGTGPIVIDEIDLKAKDFSLKQPVSIELAARLLEQGKNQNFKVAGQIGPMGEKVEADKIPVDVQVLFESFPVESLKERIPKDLPALPLSGVINGKLTVKGSLAAELTSVSQIDVQDLIIQMPDETQAARNSNPVQFSFGHNILLEYSDEKMSVESAALSLSGNRILVKGKVKNFLRTPKWDLNIWTETFQPMSLIALIPMVAEKMPEALGLEGPAEITIRTAGTKDNFKFDMNTDIRQMQVKYEALFNKPAGTPCALLSTGGKAAERITLKELKFNLHDLVMTTTGEIIQSETPRFSLRTQTNPISLEGWEELVPLLAPYHPKGNLFLRSSLFGKPDDAAMNLQVSSDQIQFVLPPAEDEKPKKAASPGSLQSLNLQLQVKRKDVEILGTGKVEIKKGEILSVFFEKMMSKFRYASEQLDITAIAVNAFKGSIQGTGGYNVSKDAWSFTPVVRNVDIGEALEKLTQYDNVFAGFLSGKFQAKGKAKDPGPGGLEAAGSMRISQGELKNFNLLGDVLDSLFGVQGLAAYLGDIRNEISRQESSRFDWLNGRFEMKKNMVNLQDIQIHNLGTSRMTDSDALLAGRVALDSKLLDLTGSVVLSGRHSQRLIRKAKALKALCNAEQRMVLPIAVKGSIQKPKPFLDTEYVAGAVTRYYTNDGAEKLKKEAERLLEDLF